MGFNPLTESQIVANLIDSYSSMVTTTDDVNIGSNIRSTFEAFAIELRRLYQNIQESAAETQKMAAYTMFGFTLTPAQASYGLGTFTVSTAPTSNVNVPAGTTVAVPNTSLQFKTQSAFTWPSGSTSQNILVQCTQVGSLGNVRANTITQLVTPISGLNNVTVTNSKDFRTGSDVETEDERANRFQQWVNSLHRGDLRSIIYGAKTAQLLDQNGYVIEQVMKAQVIEGTGSNTLYIDNGYYNSSTNLVTQCQNVINGYTDANGVLHIGYKAAGIPTTVQAATNQSINISVKITPKSGYTFNMVQTSVSNSITNLVQSLDVGETLYLQALNLAIGNTPGVLNFQVTTPVADIAPANGTLLQLGASQPVVTQL